jgi:GT2 family glycosyltransferase
MRTSVLIPSWKRGEKLRTCLRSLGQQTVAPGEVIVAWQADDTPTRDLAESCIAEANYPLRVLHAPKGIVPAENFALANATGEVILLIDDDAIAPPDWLAKHLAFYESNPKCGAVGGPAINFCTEGWLPRRAVEPVGEITWYGKHIGNMHDHVDAWKTRAPRRVQQLVGYNMSLRRAAFDTFEASLRPYWQLFEMDACLQVAARGYEVWFDFSNVIEHHATSIAYKPDRDDNLDIKIYNPAYNEAFVLSKFSPWHLRLPRLAYMLLRGATRAPGILAYLVALARYRKPIRETKIFLTTIPNRLAGWRDGHRARAKVVTRAEPQSAQPPTIASRA